MSQLIKQIEADKNKNYLFQIALDRIPEPDERDQMKKNIRDAMESLGVPPDRVAIMIFKSDAPPEIDTFFLTGLVGPIDAGHNGALAGVGDRAHDS